MTGQDPFPAARDPASLTGAGYSPAVLWATRLVVALVCAWNLTAAIPFVLNPAAYAYSFEVQGARLGGQVLIRGLGIAFLMWQVPFLPVIWHPGRYRVCFLCLLGMQLLGLAGESAMMAALPPGHGALARTGWRFIAFDSAGLLGMGLAYGVLHWPWRRKQDLPISRLPS